MNTHTRALMLLVLLMLTSVALGSQSDYFGVPTNALRRVEPKKYEVRFSVLLSTVAATANAADRGYFNLKDAPIIMPVIYQGAYNRAFTGSEVGEIHLDNQPFRDVVRTIDQKQSFDTARLRMVVPRFQGQSLRWIVTLTTQTWSSVHDEQLAQRATWPRNLEWPREVRDGLEPQPYIESNHQVFQEVVSKNFPPDQLRQLPPFLAAKMVVAFCLNNFTVVEDGTDRGYAGQVQGMKMRGALQSVLVSRKSPGPVRGTEHDLVCVVVATLRAAGIPARPVVGLSEASGKTTFRSWAEFYLPRNGWVAFDPLAMSKAGAGQYRNIRDKWPEFGTIEELNERVVLAYGFHPKAGVETPENPAVWGWDPRTHQPSYEQHMILTITGRGPGIVDPQ